MHTFATWNNLKKITMKDMMNKRTSQCFGVTTSLQIQRLVV